MTRIDRLKVIRAHEGLSAQAWSIKLGISYNLWCQYEAGRKEPSASTLEKITQQGYSLDWLFSGEGPMLIQDNQLEAARLDPLVALRQDLERALQSPSAERLLLCSDIVRRLESSQAELSIEALSAEFAKRTSPEKVEVSLDTLQKAGIVAITRGHVRLIRLSASEPYNVAPLRTLLAVQTLINTFLPAYEDGQSQAKLILSKFNVQRGQGVDEVRKLISRWREWLLTQSPVAAATDSDEVNIILAALVRS